MKRLPLFIGTIGYCLCMFFVDQYWIFPERSTNRNILSAAISGVLFFALMALFRWIQKSRDAKMSKES